MGPFLGSNAGFVCRIVAPVMVIAVFWAFVKAEEAMGFAAKAPWNAAHGGGFLSFLYFFFFFSI